MQTITCDVGIWRAQARVNEVGECKWMAVISATAGERDKAIESRHTVVFEHAKGIDATEEIKALIRQVLTHSH